MSFEFTSVEVCAGAGGQALGLEQAGFEHLACVEFDAEACKTLRANRPEWNVIHDDLRAVVKRRELREFEEVALLELA
jgi:DNA (cytosine-5)-methyltransferase 1